MSETFVVVFNGVSILCIILGCSYTITELNVQGYKVMGVLRGFFVWLGTRLLQGRKKAAGLKYNWGNLSDVLALPIMLFIAFMLINQMGLGELKFRMGVQHFIAMAYWVNQLINKILKRNNANNETNNSEIR